MSKIFSAYVNLQPEGGAVKAYPSWPIGGNEIYNLMPTYYWYTMQHYDASAELYRLYF
ncbi:MAG: hypothetical protein U5K00_00575 [Melioribacteraceae bacterium]|nr:hypothetical protein [Melioribacteraceae bacterium]